MPDGKAAVLGLATAPGAAPHPLVPRTHRVLHDVARRVPRDGPCAGGRAGGRVQEVGARGCAAARGEAAARPRTAVVQVPADGWGADRVRNVRGVDQVGQPDGPWGGHCIGHAQVVVSRGQQPGQDHRVRRLADQRLVNPAHDEHVTRASARAPAVAAGGTPPRTCRRIDSRCCSPSAAPEGRAGGRGQGPRSAVDMRASRLSAGGHATHRGDAAQAVVESRHGGHRGADRGGAQQRSHSGASEGRPSGRSVVDFAMTSQGGISLTRIGRGIARSCEPASLANRRSAFIPAIAAEALGFPGPQTRFDHFR